jgi:hypothetical protein
MKEVKTLGSVRHVFNLFKALVAAILLSDLVIICSSPVHSVMLDVLQL